MKKFTQDQPKSQSIFKKVFGQMANDVATHHKQFVPKSNVLVFKHGTSWSLFQEGDKGKVRQEGEMEVVKAEFSMDKQKIFDGDFAVVEELLSELTQQFGVNFERRMLSVLDEVARDRETINIRLSADKNDVADALVKLWREIKLSLDDDLSLAEPILFLADPETRNKLNKIVQELKAEGRDVENEIKAIKLEKHIDALIDHFENLLKYKLDDNERSSVEFKLQQLRELPRSSICRK